jgi:hypothetical protein
MIRTPHVRYIALATLAACLALTATAHAQVPSPFHAPTSERFFSLTTRWAAVDVNRDGSQDVIAPGFFFGTVLSTTDEHGAELASATVNVGMAAVPRSAAVPAPIALVGGDIDHDGREDLVFANADGSVHYQRNLGATSIDQPRFAPARPVDYFGALLAFNPPFSVMTVASIQVVDLNGDGYNDVLVGAGVHDAWSAVAAPGLVVCCISDGQGGFTNVRKQLQGSVVDVEWADVDGDGQPDSVVLIQEHGSVGAYFHELIHLSLQGGALVQTTSPQLLGAGRPTSLEIGDVDIDGYPDYVVSVNDPSGNAVQSWVEYYKGNGAGSANLSNTTQLPLPAASGVGSYIPSVQLGDFNGDGLLDLATLRGTVTSYPTLAGQGNAGPADVLVSMGPWPFQTAPTQLPLDGSFRFSHSLHVSASLLPIRPDPDLLGTLDLGTDHNLDLMVTAVRPNAAPTEIHRVTIRNGSAPRPGECAIVKAGDPSGGAPSLAARLGFDGGEPRIGNASFASTLQNVRPNCLCGLMWSDHAQPQLVEVMGFQLHIAPAVFGFSAVSYGTPQRGFTSYSLPIPNNTALIGDAGWFQYVYYDPVIDAFGGTQASGVWIGG